MKRTTIVAALPLLLFAQIPASATGMAGQDSCTSAFLNEHLGPEDGAAMLRLWAGGSSSAQPSTTGSINVAYDGETYARASRRFIALKGQYQMRCADQELAFE
jgi:hypothetical protein